MDKKDKKILTELIINSRTPLNQLAKKVGVSREVATYRLNKLKKDKIIQGFYTTINTELLGFSRFLCFFKLKKINSEKEKEFMNYIINHDFVTYFSPVIGKWNFVFDILSKDRKHLSKIIKEIVNKIRGFLESYMVINTGDELEVFQAKLLDINKPQAYKDSNKKVKFDKIDLKILELISTNSRIEYKELANKLNLTGNAIKYRIKNLENSRIIQGYTISLNARKLGYEWHNIQIKLKGNEEGLKKFLRQNPRTIYFYKYLGNENWDLDIGVIVKNSLELRDFILSLREKFGDIIKIHDIYIIVEESKPNQAPKGVFKTT